MMPKTSEFAPSFALGYVCINLELLERYRCQCKGLSLGHFQLNVLEAPLLIFFSKDVHFFRSPGGIKEVANPPFLRQDFSSS